MYFNPEIETMNRTELEILQVERLKKSIDTALHTPFYQRVLGENGITSSDAIHTLEDLKKNTIHHQRRFKEQLSFRLDCV